VNEITPAIVLATWAGGLGAAGAAVATWRIVGPGFLWLAGGSALLFGIPAALAGAGPFAWAGGALAGVAVLVARHPSLAALAMGAAGGAWLVAASLEGPALAAVSGAVLLGGVTAAMLLGHWYLVDPRMPRWALRRLAAAGAVGVLLDAAAVAALGAFPWADVDTVLGIGYIALEVTTAGLMAMVWSSLGEAGYSGVMAATGLSYLAVLSAAGASVIGRLLIEGPVLA
jgi:hypothetical protein